jgi:hypothetical protein
MEATTESERLFKKLVQVPVSGIENIEIGGDTVKFTDISSRRTFIIMVREQVKGTKVIVSVRNIEKKTKKVRPSFQKPV